ncbi:MAG: carbon monoxide dehydrogenase [Lachnospiraceae bacterium]|nr:carbon monoxide dehydrogenase [Lachnospiraceae bacterium]
MKLYDAIIHETLAAAGGAKRWPASSLVPWPVTENSELVMQRQAAFELGGSGQPSANYTLVTTDPAPAGDEVLLLGPDLPDLKADAPFARIVILETEEISEDDAGHDIIRQMEFVRYHVFPKGYMVRVSATSFEEQVRVSRDAVKQGIRFARIGRAYIDRYKAVPGVKSVKILFLTDRAAVERLKPNAKKADDITKTLSHILDGLPTDCGHCQLKPVCDEVEGMRDMHLGKKK